VSLALAAVLLLAVPGTSPLSAETTLERISRTGVVRVGFAPEAPFSFRRTDGYLTGSGPEVARRVFARMGIHDIVWVETEFGFLIGDLLDERFDVIGNGMAILPSRCREILFSEPFYKAGAGFAVRQGNPRNLHGFDDVAADPTIRLGVVDGAVEMTYARASGVADNQLIVYPDATTAADGVRSGRVDAFAGMAVTVQNVVSRGLLRLERATPFRDPVLGGRNHLGYGGFGFRPADADLRDAFNRALADLLRSTVYLDVVEPFGFTATELPDRTADELCAG
jgi:polar amino acid transport system substrate-binding protein